jgi:hypothetical protein
MEEKEKIKTRVERKERRNANNKITEQQKKGKGE